MRVVPGLNSVSEALKIRPQEITELWIRDGELNADLSAILAQATKEKVKVVKKSSKFLDSQVASHQGIMAFVRGAPQWPDGVKLEGLDTGFIIALDCLEDPHNVGSLMRTAWNLSAIGVIITKDRSAGQAASAQKVGCGAFEHVPLLEASNLAAELKSLKELGFWIYGLQKESSVPIGKMQFGKKSVLVVGAEEHGLRKPTAGFCDELISLPQSPTSNSFNASVAGALAAYEFVRQHDCFGFQENSTKKL